MQAMKVRAFAVSGIVIFAALTIAGVCQSQDQPAPRFTLKIMSDRLGVLDVHQTNISNEEIREGGCVTVGGSFKITVEFDGVPLEEKKDVQAHRKRGDLDRCYNGLIQPPRIKPGAHIETYAIPSRFYDMSTPGEYIVTVSKETYPDDPAKSVTVTSDPYVMTVTRAEANAFKASQAKQDALGPLTLTADESSVTAGEPVIVYITRKNMTDKTLFLRETNDVIRWYDFDVQTDSGPAQETQDLRNARAPNALFIDTMSRVSLEPGETTKNGMYLTNYYDMSAPGVYHVTASLICPQCDPSQVVRSNTVTITVLPAGSTPSAQQ